MKFPDIISQPQRYYEALAWRRRLFRENPLPWRIDKYGTIIAADGRIFSPAWFDNEPEPLAAEIMTAIKILRENKHLFAELAL